MPIVLGNIAKRFPFQSNKAPAIMSQSESPLVKPDVKNTDAIIMAAKSAK